LTPNFTTAQASGDLTAVTFTDTSTSPTPGLTGRLITLRKYNGTYLVPDDYSVDYIFWPIASSSLTVIDLLDRDYALDVNVRWFLGSTVDQTKTVLTAFTGYSDVFLRQLTQAVAADRILITRQNYWENKIKLRTLVDDCNQAVSLINDQTIAQFCLDEAKKLTDNISTFF
jgi:hypothetical protein